MKKKKLHILQFYTKWMGIKCINWNFPCFITASIAKNWKPQATNANSAQASAAGTSAELSMGSVEPKTEMKPMPMLWNFKRS